MFYVLHTSWQLTLLLTGLAAFTVVSWHRPSSGAWLILFGTPLYLLKIASCPFTVLEALIWIFAALWLFQKIKNRNFNWRFFEFSNRRFGLALGLILVGVFLASVFSSDWRASFGIFKAYFVAPLIFSFILVEIFKEGGVYRLAFLAWLASSAAVGAIAAVYLLFGRLTFDSRLAAFYLSPNHVAMWLVPGLIVGFGLWLEVKKNYQRILLFIVYCLLLIVTYFTYSYGAWLGLAGAAVFILFCFWKYKIISRRRLVFICCLLLVLFAAIFFLQLRDGHNEKLISLLTSSRSSWQSRIMVWQSAEEILKDHWFLGVGPGLFQKHYLEYQQYFPVPYLEWAVPQPHNLFLSWWLQAGFLGLAGFILLIWDFFQSGFKALRLKNTILPADREQENDDMLLSWMAQAQRPTPTISPSQREGEKKRGWVSALATKQPLIIFSMAVIIYFLIHGLVDTTFWKNDLALIFWVIIFLGRRASRRAC